jgi:hypothetical protein
VCTLRNRFSRHEWWEADGGAGVGLSWRTVAGYPVSCHEDEEKGKFPSGRHFGKNQSAEHMQILLKDGIQGFVSVYVFNLNCFQLKERISMQCVLYRIPEGKKKRVTDKAVNETRDR